MVEFHHVPYDAIHEAHQKQTNKKEEEGPLHTQAESRDCGIVRAQKKVSKGGPNTPPKSCRSVVTDSQV